MNRVVAVLARASSRLMAGTEVCGKGASTLGVIAIGLVLILALGMPATADEGSITVNIRNLQGNDIGAGPYVKADLWGVSKPKSGGGYIWHTMDKQAIVVGGVSSVTWTKEEIEGKVDLADNDFWFSVSVWGGSPWANTQISSPSGLWDTFIEYDASLPAASWTVRVITEDVFPATLVSDVLYYDLDLTGATYLDSWAYINITYKDCLHDSQPVLDADKRAYMEGEGFSFSFNSADNWLKITKAGTGFNESYSAREHGSGGYILELETLGEGSVIYDALSKKLIVGIDYVDLGLKHGDTFFCRVGFDMALADPTYGTYGDLYATGSSGAVGHALDPLTVTAPVRNVDTGAGYFTIQEAIDEATTSDTIEVAAGTYPEELTIDKPLSILGSGSSSTFVTGGIKIGGTSAWSGLLLKDLYLTGDVSGNPKDALIDLDGAPVVSDFTIEGCVLDGEGDPDRMAFYGDNVYSGDWTWEDNEIKGFRSWFLIDNTHSVAPSGVTHALGEVVFKDNYIHDCYGSIAFRGKPGDETNSVVITGNTFEGYPGSTNSQAWAAIEVNIAASLIMYDNSIHGVPEVSWGGEGQALQIWGIETVDIHDNSFTNCYQGIWVFGGEAGGTYGGPYAVPLGAIYNNTIAGNSDYGIAVENTATGGPLDAKNNYWGHASGPSGEGSGTGDGVSANVDYDPWLLEEDGNTTSETESETITGSGTMEDTSTGGDVTIDATGEHTITTAKYEDNPGGTTPFSSSENYYDVHLDDATGVNSLSVEFCPATASTIIYYWDGADWQRASDQVYADACIVVTITSTTFPCLADLTGLILASSEVTAGDVNDDGYVNVIDVRLCLQIATGFIVGNGPQLAAADVDGDGDVDRDDAELLARYIIGIEDKLGGD